MALRGNATAVRSALAAGPLHEWASRQPGAQALAGRGAAWAVALGSGDAVVVRHSRHGGALGSILGDRFVVPTRAPRELANALRLARAGVPTPEVVAYAVYPAMWPLARADVMTRRVAGVVFPDAWRAAEDGTARTEIVQALATLLLRLRDAGALHPDLNLRNVLIAGAARTRRAFVLDVDRVEFGRPGSRSIAARNLARVVRSARKWKSAWGVDLEDESSTRVLSMTVAGEPAGLRT